MPTATDTLRAEHSVILRGLALLEIAAERLARSGSLPAGWWDELLDWLRAFADDTHHGKEEQYLFPALAKAGVPATGGGPIAVMLTEHDQGRALVRAMAAGDAASRVAAARGYVWLLRDHIEKENGVLFPLAEAVLDPDTQRLVLRGFERVEADVAPATSIARAEAAVDRLAAALEN